MSAFNLLKFSCNCPNCNKISNIVAQFHYASSFRLGEYDQRLCNYTYKIGDKISWKPDIAGKEEYWDRAQVWDRKSGDAIECCYAECVSCKYDLFAVVKFKFLSIAGVCDVGIEEDWPTAYNK